MPRKIAFIHNAKVAGRYIDYYLRSHIFENKEKKLTEQQYKVFNSWGKPFFLGRDWTESELLQLANNRFSMQQPTPEQVKDHHQHWTHNYLDKQYVHEHDYSWTEKSIRQFRSNGWFTFMFIREPAEKLCSYWTWAREMVADGSDPEKIIRPARLVDLSLDAFFRETLGTPGFPSLYALPDYTDDIEYVAEFTKENFSRFLRDQFNHDYRPELVPQQKRFASSNPGYAVYRNQGLISDTTHDLLQKHPEIQKIRKRLS